jgi:DNA-binding beta-propeller fold protein YncE
MPMRRFVVCTLLALLQPCALASGVLEYVGSTPTGCAVPPLPVGTLAGRVVSPEGDLYEIRSEGTARWRRNPATGALTIELQSLSDPRLVVTQPDPYYNSLPQAAFTPDGRHVVLGLPADSPGNGRIVVVERDVATGTLMAITQEIADSGVDASALVIAPDGRHVYLAGVRRVGGPTNWERTIQIFQRDAVTGMLTPLGSTPIPQSDASAYRAVVGSADGLHLYGLAWDYVKGEGDAILLEAWARDPITGLLSPLQTEPLSFRCECAHREWGSPVISPDGADLYVYAPGNVIQRFRRAPATGLLTRAGSSAIPPPRRYVNGPLQLRIRPDGGFLYVESGAVLARDTATGALTYTGMLFDFDRPMIGFASDGDLITEGPRVYRLAGPTGFGPMTDDDGVSGGAGAMAPSPDGAHMYVHCLEEDAIAWFDVDQDRGVLTPAGKFVDGGGGLAPGTVLPAPLVVSPDGRHVYAGSVHGEGLAILNRDATTGALTFAGALRQSEGGIDGLSRLSHIALTADGTSLYAAGYAPGVYSPSPTLAVFARDVGSGALTQRQLLAEWDESPVGYNDALIALPEDGQQVYFFAGLYSKDDSYYGPRDAPTSVLRRDPVSGWLDAGQPLRLAGWPSLGPGGVHYYVAGSPILVRGRDPVTGSLRGVQSLPATSALGRLTIGGGAGEYAHAALLGSGSITTLRRDPVSGMLREIQRAWGGPHLGPLVFASRDGRHVYGVGRPSRPTDPSPNAIAHYRRREPCAPAPLAGCHVPTRSGAASLMVIDQAGERDQLKLRWTRGTAVTRAELGEPDVSTEYAVCVYDAAGPQPVTSLLVPPGISCFRDGLETFPTLCWEWRAQGFAYRNRERTPDGVALMSVKPGGDGETSLRVQANKGAVPPLGLPLDAPVVVQVQAGNGTCWEARFSNLTVNDGTKLVARSD